MYTIPMESILQGTIIHGEGQGKTIGFPTANLDTPSGNIEHPLGVYGGYTVLENTDKKLPCAIVIRMRNNEKKMEVHILDFTEDIYEKSMIVTLRWFIRPWETFTDMDVLKKQITKDIASIRNHLKTEF